MKKVIFLLPLLICCLLYGQKKHVKPPARQTAAASPATGFINFTILHNGGKTEINNKQFETSGGAVLPGGSGQSVILSYGASNSTGNNSTFSWMFTVPVAAKGTYTIGNNVAQTPASLFFSTSAFPKIPQFMVKSGSITLDDCPLPGGFIKGSFSVILTGGVTTDGVLDETEYALSGSFSILR